VPVLLLGFNPFIIEHGSATPALAKTPPGASLQVREAVLRAETILQPIGPLRGPDVRLNLLTPGSFQSPGAMHIQPLFEGCPCLLAPGPVLLLGLNPMMD